MAKAQELFREKIVFSDGAIMELVLWRLPAPDRERPHGLKYRLFYGKDGKRLVLYDNERGKGDHRHILDIEKPYRFVSRERLLQDFLDDVKHLRGDLDE